MTSIDVPRRTTKMSAYSYGCKHYKRKCLFIAPCCKEIYVCRLCHDEKEAHKMDRAAVTDIVCMLCGEVQKVNNKCKTCGTLFGKYFCLKCRLYDDEDKGQFHCNGCGHCRSGGKDKFYHCKTCGICYSVTLKDKHMCIKDISRGNCPKCNEYMHTSSKELHIPPCGHLLHRECLNRWLEEGTYACITCAKSMTDMKEIWKVIDKEVAVSKIHVPEEYERYNVFILCNDCQKEGVVLYHPYGVKCSECGSYNTIWSDIPDALNTEQPHPKSLPAVPNREKTRLNLQRAVSRIHTSICLKEETVSDGEVPGARRL